MKFTIEDATVYKIETLIEQLYRKLGKTVVVEYHDGGL